MALTQSAWTAVSRGHKKNRLVASCTVVAGAAGDRYQSTLVTPPELDTAKPFTLIVTTGENMTAAGTTVTNIYGATEGNASVGSTGTLTSCSLVHANTNDIDAGATTVINVFPGISGTLTQVTNASPGTALVPAAPWLIFSTVTSADLNAAPATVSYTIYQ